MKLIAMIIFFLISVICVFPLALLACFIDFADLFKETGEGNGNPLQCSCLENPRDGGAWWAGVYGVAQSRTRLKWLSSSSSMHFSLKLSQTFPFRNPIRQSILFLFVFNILLSSYTSILFKSLKKCLTFPDLNTITTFFLLFINRIAVWALQ